MDKGPLVADKFDASRRLLDEFAKYVPVVVAFWLKEAECDPWRLCIASDHINERNLDVAYGEVLRILGKAKDPNLDAFQIRLLLMSDPLVRGVLKLYEYYSATIPLYVNGRNVQGFDIEEIYLVRGPTGEYVMPTGRETLHQIIDQEAAFFQQNGLPPRKIKLPVLMAYELAKCGREDLGELSGRIFKDGINVLEKEGFHGMNVEIVRDRNAVLQFE